MKIVLFLAAILLGCHVIWAITSTQQQEQDAVITWLKDTNAKAQTFRQAQTLALWNKETSLTDANTQKLKTKTEELDNYLKKTKADADTKFQDYFDSDTKRQLNLYKLYASPKDPATLRRMLDIQADMENKYTTAKNSLNVDTNNIYQIWKKLEWKKMQDTVARPSRDLYLKFVTLSNDGAKQNGFSDKGHYWRMNSFGMDDIGQVADRLYSELAPMYKLLFAYVRRELRDRLGTGCVSGIEKNGPIPQHLNNWFYLQDENMAIPYPGVKWFDIAGALREKGYTIQKIATEAEDFYESIGLSPMTNAFWMNSSLEKPDGRDMSCAAGSFDMRSANDFRIKYCGKLDESSRNIITSLIGQVEYYMAYSAQPDIYRQGANAAFLPAASELATISSNTVAGMKRVGILDDSNLTKDQKSKQDINFLMREGLYTFGYMPLSYIIDKWRWGLFDGSITSQNANRKWWEMRLKYEGSVPPVTRSEKDLDPLEIFHLPYDVSYLRYFISTVYTYQFYKAMCVGHSGPLHLCDFYGSTTGSKLKEMIELGRSLPWQDALEKLTGQREISTDAILEYFAPLKKWLEKEMGDDKGEWLQKGETVESIIGQDFI